MCMFMCASPTLLGHANCEYANFYFRESESRSVMSDSLWPHDTVHEIF